MLRFLAGLVGGDESELGPNVSHRAPLVTALPELCAALCGALASREHLTELALDPCGMDSGGLAAASDFLLRTSVVLPNEFPPALSAGLSRAHCMSKTGIGAVTESSGMRLQ